MASFEHRDRGLKRMARMVGGGSSTKYIVRKGLLW